MQSHGTMRFFSNPDYLQKCDLVRKIVDTEIKEAQHRQQQPSNIAHIIASLSKDMPWEQRLNLLKEKIHRYPARPVITAHPTMVYSEDAVKRLHEITRDVCILDKPNITIETRNKLIHAIKINFNKLIEHSMLPTQCLTPREEAQRGQSIYKEMLNSYSKFRSSIEEEFHRQHGGDIIEITTQLSPAIKTSYLEIGSWIKGDTDGNPNVTASTMAQTVPDQQKAIIEIYLRHLFNILHTLDITQHPDTIEILQEHHDYLTNRLGDINAGIWFNLTGSQALTQKMVQSLEKINADNNLPAIVREKTKALRDLLELVGFAGGLKEFVRQTTQVNDSVFAELISLLAEGHADIKKIITGARVDNYSALNDEAKAEIHKLLEVNSIYFETLKKNAHLFSEITQKELDRLFFILVHKDIFPYYIYSDTKTPINFEEVRILTWFAAFRAGKLYINQITQHPFFNIPLCETPEDIKNIGKIISAMLENPSMRENIVAQGYLSYVGGPSDLGKTGGIMTHVLLIMAQMEVEDILKEYQTKFPELAHVTLRVLHGFGGDMKRRMGADRQLHATYQGAAAYYALGAPGAYYSFLHRVVGHPSEADCKVTELRQLKQNHPTAFNKALENLTQGCIVAFEKYVNDPHTKELLQALTFIELERKMNTSSRAGSKAAKKADPSKARAIGFLNHYLLAGVHADIYMSLVGIEHLSDEDKAMLPELFNLTVIKDIVYKTMFAIATSHFTRAKQKLDANNNAPALAKHTLADWQAQAIKVLHNVTHFLPAEKAQHAQTYLKTHLNMDISKLTLSLMREMGADFSQLANDTETLLPHYQRLADCLEAYRERPSPITEENAILACRGVRDITEGPEFIAELTSPLHLSAELNRAFAPPVEQWRARL